MKPMLKQTLETPPCTLRHRRLLLLLLHHPNRSHLTHYPRFIRHSPFVFFPQQSNHFCSHSSLKTFTIPIPSQPQKPTTNPPGNMSAANLSAAHVSSASNYVGLWQGSSKLPALPAQDSVAWTRKTISNGSRIHCMKTWNPIANKKFETLSYLPPLSDESIAKEIDYMLKNAWIPCLEFDVEGFVQRENSRMPGYYDGRYWTLWKLPMFGCNDPSQVLNEIQECKKAHPNAYIRCLAFDNTKQCQCMAFIIQKPATTAAPPQQNIF